MTFLPQAPGVDVRLRKAVKAAPRFHVLLSLTASSAALLTILGGTPAWSQEAAQPLSRDNGKIEEVVVTARYRTENIQRTPVAVTAMTADMLRNRGMTNLVQVAEAAPDVVMESGSSGYGSQTNQAYIRGLGQQDFNFAFEPRVGFYIDDVYYSTTFGAVFDLLDISRVEILRGPQGTLFGRDAVGGAIRIITQKPTGDGTGYLEASAGSFDSYSVKGQIDMPLIGDKVSAILSVGLKTSKGWVALDSFKCLHPALGGNLPGVGQGPGGNCQIGTLGGETTFDTRDTVRWRINSHMEDVATFDYTQSRSDAPAEVLVAPLHLNQQNPDTGVGDPTLANGLATWFANPSYTSYWNVSQSPQMLAALVPDSKFVSTALYGNARTGFSNPPSGSFTSWGVANNFDWNITPDLSVTSISAYRWYNGNFGQSILALPGEEVRQFVRHTQLSEELHLKGTAFDGKLEWLLGGFFMHTIGWNPSRLQTEGFTFGLDFFTNDKTTLSSLAGFAHAIYHITPDLSLTAGIRYSSEDKSYRFVRDYTPSGLSVLNFVQTDRGSYQRTNPKVTASYQITPDIMAYATYATAFTAGGFNPRPFSQSDAFSFAPEDVTSYEGGIKSELFDHRVRLNLAGYWTDFQNIQVYLQGGAGTRTTSPFYYDNGGDAHIKGLEGELEARPTDHWLLSASASIMQFQYYRLASNSNGLTLDSPDQGVPNFQFSFGTQYSFDCGDAGIVTPRFDIRYRSRTYYTTNKLDTSAIQPGYAVANARITWDAPKGDWEVTLAINNLFDKYYYTYLNDQRDTFGWAYGDPAKPRTFEVTLRRTF